MRGVAVEPEAGVDGVIGQAKFMSWHAAASLNIRAL